MILWAARFCQAAPLRVADLMGRLQYHPRQHTQQDNCASERQASGPAEALSNHRRENRREHAAHVSAEIHEAAGGANLLAAAQIANRLGPGHRVVTVQVDSGLKYLSVW